MPSSGPMVPRMARPKGSGSKLTVTRQMRFSQDMIDDAQELGKVEQCNDADAIRYAARCGFILLKKIKNRAAQTVVDAALLQIEREGEKSRGQR